MNEHNDHRSSGELPPRSLSRQRNSGGSAERLSTSGHSAVPVIYRPHNPHPRVVGIRRVGTAATSNNRRNVDNPEYNHDNRRQMSSQSSVSFGGGNVFEVPTEEEEGNLTSTGSLPKGSVLVLDDPDLYRPATPILNWPGPKRSLKPPKPQLWLFLTTLQVISMVVVVVVLFSFDASERDKATIFAAVWVAFTALLVTGFTFMSTTRHLHQLTMLMESINTLLDMDRVVESLQNGRFSRFEETWKVQVHIIKMFCRLLKYHHGVNPMTGQVLCTNAGWNPSEGPPSSRQRRSLILEDEGIGGYNDGEEEFYDDDEAAEPLENGVDGTALADDDREELNVPVRCCALPNEDTDTCFSVAEGESDEERTLQQQQARVTVEARATPPSTVHLRMVSSESSFGGTPPPAIHSRSASGTLLGATPTDRRPKTFHARLHRQHSPKSRRGSLVGSSTGHLHDGDPGGDNDTDWDTALGPESNVSKSRGLLWRVLKNVKLGSDLSKIPLPVDVLEPRSMLEKLSDLFVHPDMFGRIAHFSDPMQRMIALCRWYLSGYHVRPKGPRKPYNPILGETFDCSFLPGTPDEVRYIAEQVSHHPPASNFHCVHLGSGTYATASFWPKSRLQTPNSISSPSEGRLTIFVPQQNDVYEMVWPAFYCSGLLKSPARLEVAGKVTIRATSGVRGVLEFKRKPWFSGEYDEVHGELFAKGAQQPSYTIQGIWHSHTTITRTEQAGLSGEPEVLFNSGEVNAVRPVVGQTPFKKPSRAIWIECTNALRANDAKAAQVAKDEVEGNERLVRLAREARGEEYRPALFRLTDRPKKISEGTWKWIGPALRPLTSTAGSQHHPYQTPSPATPSLVTPVGAE